MKQNYFSQQIVMLYHTFKDEQRNVKQPPKLQYVKDQFNGIVMFRLF